MGLKKFVCWVAKRKAGLPKGWTFCEARTSAVRQQLSSGGERFWAALPSLLVPTPLDVEAPPGDLSPESFCKQVSQPLWELISLPTQKEMWEKSVFNLLQHWQDWNLRNFLNKHLVAMQTFSGKTNQKAHNSLSRWPHHGTSMRGSGCVSKAWMKYRLIFRENISLPSLSALGHFVLLL